MKLGALFIALSLAVVVLADSPSDYFSDHDAQVTRKVVLASQNEDGTFPDVATADFGVSVLQLLNTEVPHKEKVCSFGKKALQHPTTVATVSHAISLIETLGCGEKVAPEVLRILEGGLESGSLLEIYQSLSALALLKEHRHTDFAKDLSGVAKSVHSLMEVDGTFKSGNKEEEEGTALSTGYAYHALALLKKHFPLSAGATEHLDTVVSTVDDFFSTAREEDGLLEFTDPNPLSNLKATSLVWTGANELGAVTKAVEISQAQIVGLAEYFVKHKYITNTEDAYYLLKGLKTIAVNSFHHSPLVLTLPKSSILTSSKGDEGLIKVYVTDIFGHFATNVGVYIVKVFPVDHEKQIILRNQQALPVSDGPQNLAYSFNFLATKPDQGFYSMEFSVAPVDKSSAFFPIEEATRTVKVVAFVELADVSLQLIDSKESEEDGFASNPISLRYPDTLDEVLRANVFQTVVFSFRCQASGRPIAVHQAFLRFTNLETQHEAVFVAEQQGKKYKLSVNLKDNLDAFQGRSGKYAVTLIIGDSLIQNPVSWEVATINIQFGKLQKDAVAEVASGPQSEIMHQFKPPDKRPPPVVSYVFTALVLTPFLLFLVGLTYVGANLSNFPLTSTSFFFAAGFQVCVGSLFGLFFIYWLRLNMVQTLCYLLGLALVTIFFGQHALRYVASLRGTHKKAD